MVSEAPATALLFVAVIVGKVLLSASPVMFTAPAVALEFVAVIVGKVLLSASPVMFKAPAVTFVPGAIFVKFKAAWILAVRFVGADEETLSAASVKFVAPILFALELLGLKMPGTVELVGAALVVELS